MPSRWLFGNRSSSNPPQGGDTVPRVHRVGFVLAALALFAPAAAGSRSSPTLSPTTAIFYYPWFGTPGRDGEYFHWEQNGHQPSGDLASAFYPMRGPYSSSDASVLDGQMREIERAGIGEVVVSWWGRGSPVDQRLPAVIAAAQAHSLEIAAHLEPYAGRSIAGTAIDIVYLRTLGIRDFFVYHATDFPAAEWQPLTSSFEDVRLFAQTPQAGYAKQGGFDGVYTYDTLTYRPRMFARMCKAAHKLALLCSPSVGPGYNALRATGDSRVLDRRGGKTYDSIWTAALRAGTDVATITSYNEWNEGTQIEPACPRQGYESYDGAWGERGKAAERAYLNRTRLWTSRFNRQHFGRTAVDERG
jgi:glycoprotein endo-alpha-1,2-mannosidase